MTPEASSVDWVSKVRTRRARHLEWLAENRFRESQRPRAAVRLSPTHDAFIAAPSDDEPKAKAPIIAEDGTFPHVCAGRECAVCRWVKWRMYRT